MRVLLIDDTAAYHDEFAQLLADSGVRYSALDRATTAADGAKLMLAQVHDIYVVDYRMPGENGLALIKHARQAGVTKPIILLTAFDNPQVDAAAEAAGANDYMQKGEFTTQALGRSLRYAIRNAAALEAATAAAAQAREAESRFAMAQEAADIGVWDWDLSTNVFTWSDRQYAAFGLDPRTTGPVEYETWLSAIHPEDRDAVQGAVTASIARDAPFSARFRVVHQPRDTRFDGPTIHWLSSKGRVVRDQRGNPVRMVGVSIDVTEQQNALRAIRDSRNLALAGLRLSEGRFRTYFDSAPECLFYVVAKPSGRVEYEAINPSGLKSIGRSLEEVRGRTPEEVLGPDVGGTIADGLRRVVETGTPFLYEPTFPMQFGTVVYDAIYLPLFDDSGTVVGVLGSARDITEQRRLEATLRQSQKMEALGQLAGGVAHDFNNLLTGMLGCIDLLGRHVTSEKGQELLREGRRTVERGTGLTSRLLTFSRQQPLLSQPVDFNAALEDMTGLLTRTLGGVEIGKRFAPDLWMARADRNQVELAILNLAINARDAMPVGGALTIETKNEVVLRPQDDDLAPGHYVAISVSDTGLGMPPDILARALDPFFTTKPEGAGTGLGLSMVYGMVTQLGGGMRIRSEMAKGTEVTLLFPRAGEAERAEAQPVLSAAPRNAAIMLVEPDKDTQTAVAAYTAELGLEIIIADSSAQALALLEAGCSVSLMIADATLPGLSGKALIQRAQEVLPALAGLFISGRETGEEVDASGVGLLAKPFDRAAFARAVLPLLKQAGGPDNVVPIRH